MEVHKKFKEEINKIWSNFQDIDVCEYPALLPETALENAILIVGLNPSSPLKNEKTQIDVGDTKTSSYPQHGGGEIHKYFRRFPLLVKNTNYNWTHIDLLFLRKTDSTDVKKLWKEKKEFILAQLKVSTEIIKALNPKIIVINNAFGRELLESFQEEGNYSISEFDPKIGTYYFNKTPLFFSSMFEGPSPMDNGTFERLKWHIKWVLDNHLTEG
jgi:hypothetical protein